MGGSISAGDLVLLRDRKDTQRSIDVDSYGI